MLVGDRKSPVIALIEGKLGYKVRVSQYVGEVTGDVPQLSEEDVDETGIADTSSRGGECNAYIA